MLFLDEPFAGVHPRLREELIDADPRAPRRAAARSSSSITTWSRSCASRERLVVMARGSKIADGEPAAVRADQDVLRGLRRGSEPGRGHRPLLRRAQPGRGLPAGHRHPPRHLGRGDARAGRGACSVPTAPASRPCSRCSSASCRRARARSTWTGSPCGRSGPHEMGRHGVVYLPQRPSIFPVPDRRGEPAARRVALPRRARPRRGAGGPGVRAVPGAGGAARAVRRHAERRPAAPARDRAQPDARSRRPAHRRAHRRRRAARGGADLRADPRPGRAGQGDPAGRPEHQAARSRSPTMSMSCGPARCSSEGSREEFGGDTEALVARWLYASGDA